MLRLEQLLELGGIPSDHRARSHEYDRYAVLAGHRYHALEPRAVFRNVHVRERDTLLGEVPLRVGAMRSSGCGEDRDALLLGHGVPPLQGMMHTCPSKPAPKHGRQATAAVHRGMKLT